MLDTVWNGEKRQHRTLGSFRLDSQSWGTRKEKRGLESRDEPDGDVEGTAASKLGPHGVQLACERVSSVNVMCLKIVLLLVRLAMKAPIMYQIPRS